MAPSSLPARTRLRLPFAALLWVLVMGGAGTFASCYGHNCDGTSTIYGLAPGEGELLTPDSWESSPSNGNAIPYTRQRTILFEIPAFTGRRFVDIQAFVSAEENPTAANTNTTPGAGNLAEITWEVGQFVVHNDTCADYFVRVYAVAETVPTNSAPISADGGVESSGDSGSTP